MVLGSFILFSWGVEKCGGSCVVEGSGCGFGWGVLILWVGVLGCDFGLFVSGLLLRVLLVSRLLVVSVFVLRLNLSMLRVRWVRKWW